MQDLKGQLDEGHHRNNSSAHPKEIVKLHSLLQSADVERRRLETELYQIKRQKIELESQIQLMSKENKIMKQKNENHIVFIQKKDQVISELEREVVRMREKSQTKYHAMEVEN